VVLNGRSGPSAQARTVLDELRGAGTSVRVVPGDIAEPGVAERLVAAAREDGTPLRGIVHAAGVFADALVGDVTPGDLSRVWAPKVAGARRLHEALENHGALESAGGAELDWFVLFSSAAALLGSPGQAAYATANAWLDAFAAWRRAQGGPALAINWGVWSEAGRAGDIALPGIDPISPDEGVEALESLLAERRTAAGIIRIDPAAAAAAYPEITDLAFFDSLLSDGGTAAAGGEWPGAEAVRAAEPERRRMLIGQRARSQVAAVLGLPGDQVPPDLALVDAGMDSLAAQRIANLLSRDLAVTVDPGPLLRGATVAQLEKSLAAALDAPADGAAPPPAHEALPPADGAALPRAALHRAAPRGVEPRDAAERQVARVAADVLGPLAGVTGDLRRAGLTEVTQAEIAARLARETGRDLDAAALFAVPTVEAAAETVRQAEDADSAGIVRLIRAGGAKAPVLLAHPAGGTTGVYRALAGLLGDDRPVFGLERLGGEVRERSGRYVEAILERFPGGGWVLGGWSFGGVLGYETARQLTAAGHRVALLVLLDAALPLPVPAGSEDQALARRFTAFADYLSRTYGRTVRLAAGELLGLAEDAQLDLVMRRMAEAGLTEELSPAILRHQHTSHEDTRALERYRAEPYDGPVVLYRAERETPWAVPDPRYEITGETRGWDRLCRGLEAVGIDAHHLNLLDPPGVGAVAAHLRALLNRIGGEQ
jgi:phthiocerol/phenolphthiocerol synthesis type-I polyketide synthase D